MTVMQKHPRSKVLSTYELMQRFPNEQAAIDYIAGILWANGTICPFCGSKRTSPRPDNFHRCKDCRKDFTIRVGTIFERSHIPLHKWLYAMYMIVTARKGVSSLQLSKELGITQKSAWFLEQRIRAACGNQATKILSGIIEVDETYLGGLEKNKHNDKKLKQGRGTVGKTPVFGMRERENGQVVAKVVKTTDAPTLQGAINSAVVPGSQVCTDEHRSYIGLDSKYIHKTVKHSAKQFVDGMAYTNGIESVWAVLKRGFYGIYHSFSQKHTQFYVDEFVFRLNEGNCKYDTVNRLHSLVQGIKGKRLTYEMLRSGNYYRLNHKP
jgi:transposase-like protein